MSILGDFGFNWHTLNFHKWNEEHDIKMEEQVANKVQPNYNAFEKMSPEAQQFTQENLNKFANQLQEGIISNRIDEITKK